MRVRRMLSCALTNELASSINWPGKMVKEQARQKRAFKDTFLNMCIFDALTLQMGVGKVSQYEYIQAVQKWLRYAPYRVGGTAHQTTTTVPLVPPETNLFCHFIYLFFLLHVCICMIFFLFFHDIV